MRRLTTACLLIFATVLPSSAAIPGNARNDSFNKAKTLMLKQVYADHRVTFYCRNPFTADSKVIPSPQHYTPRNRNTRSARIEWEHIVPAEAFGNAFKEWREGHPSCVDSKGKSFKGRNCARKMNRAFRFMEADLHNLVPAIGEINGNRSNYTFAMIEGEPRAYGACDMEIQDRKAEPAPYVRGDIARIYLYMDAAYPGRGILSDQRRQLFDAWNRQDPVDTWECERNRRIQSLQGNHNPFVQKSCS